MSIKAKKSEGGGTYEPVPEGTHLGILYSIVHIGTISGWEGKLQEKVRLTFELPTVLKEFKEGEGEKPMVISKECTLSTHEKSALRPIIEALNGKSLGEEDEFEVTDLMGKSCLLSIKQKDKKTGEGKYAFIDSASPVVKGMDIPKQTNKEFIWDYDDNYDDKALSEMPQFIQDKVRSSEEWRTKNDIKDDDITSF